MKNVIFTIWLFILGSGSQNLLAQNSARAVMEIRVEVIEGRQAELIVSDISFNDTDPIGRNGYLFGTVDLNVSETTDCIVSAKPQIKIKNVVGETAALGSQLVMNQLNSGNMRIEMYGQLAKSGLSAPGLYQGSHVVEIEYF